MSSADDQARLFTLAQSEMGGQQAIRDNIMSRVPEWGKHENVGTLKPGTASTLRQLHPHSLQEKSEKISTDPNLAKLLLDALKIEGETHPIAYALTLLYDVVRDDTSRYDNLVEAWADRDIFMPFSNLLERPGIDNYVADKAAFMLSGLMCRGPKKFSTDQIKYFVSGLVSGRYTVSEAGKLEGLGNLLKIENFRQLVWEAPGAIDVVFKHLDPDKSAAILYKAAFCVWLLSFSKPMIASLVARGAVKSLRRVLAESRVEKVVRVCIHTLTNLMADENAMEQVVELNTLQVLQLLEYEKWRDPEMYDEIRDGIASLQSKIKLYSNFERYEKEMEKGELKWSFLHQEKFWYENVMKFEQDEFKPIKKLVAILKNPSADPTTLAVACHDLGEFGRLHPMGKKILGKLGVKETTMLLMSHNTKEVAREALLCVQKLMLERWQDVGSSTAAPANGK
eukprot:GDKI01006092.1.p1 GENE.GDKI01006092.1~~GDKI01006092.1.p1  ORF type:complete len:452 (+),score=164.35 GDKI01006092.1:165-1520(+)